MDQRGGAFIGSRALAVAIDPVDANKVYVSANNAIYRSSDGGSNWVKSVSGLNGTTPYAIAVAPGVVYVGTDNGVFKSVDGAVSWATANVGFVLSGSSDFTFSVAVDPQTPTTVYANPRGAVYRSVDSGANWTALGVGGAYLAVDAQSPNTIYSLGNGGVSRSTNGGISWTAVNTGLTHTNTSTADVLAVAVDTRAGGGVFVGTEGGVFRSSKAAATGQHRTRASAT